MKKSIFIIAEVGINHNGNLNTAKKLIDEAEKTGADAVKFQSFKVKRMISKNAKLANYQKKISQELNQFDLVKKYELSNKQQIELYDYCKKKSIMFLSSPFDSESLQLILNLGIKIIKIPSGEISNIPFLKEIGKTKKKIILSTGMSYIADIEKAIQVLTKAGTKYNNITLLHCNTEYPTPFKDVNLNAMITIKNTFKLPIGYSDHSMGIEIPIAAAVLGARVIEKHFTLNKDSEGPDHKASLEPHEFKKMVESVRNIEKAMGDGIKKPSKSELKNMKIARKSIVAAKEISQGTVFNKTNLTVKRPGNGLNPLMWDQIMGKKAIRNFKKDDLIQI